MDGWHNATRAHPCPVCGKPDWCSISDDGRVCVCRRVPSEKLVRSGCGWIHPLGAGRTLPVRMPKPLPNAQVDMAAVFRRLPHDEAKEQELAATLGVELSAVKAMDAMWNGRALAWAFPMRSAEGHITGIRYRNRDGRKWSALGSRDGLFMAPDFPPTETLYVCEGPTDTLAALSMGLWAVGRSSCMSGIRHIQAYIRKHRAKAVKIIADNDFPGLNGAWILCRHLHAGAQIVLPPYGHKDLRQARRAASRLWYNTGIHS